MGDLATKAQRVMVPIAGRVWQIDVTASAQVFDIPEAWRGNYVQVTVEGDSVDLLFGGESLSVGYEVASGVSTEVLTPNATTGARIVDGTTREFYVTKDPTTVDFAVIGDSTSGRLYISLA